MLGVYIAAGTGAIRLLSSSGGKEEAPQRVGSGCLVRLCLIYLSRTKHSTRMDIISDPNLQTSRPIHCNSLIPTSRPLITDDSDDRRHLENLRILSIFIYSQTNFIFLNVWLRCWVKYLCRRIFYNDFGIWSFEPDWIRYTLSLNQSELVIKIRM